MQENNTHPTDPCLDPEYRDTFEVQLKQTTTVTFRTKARNQEDAVEACLAFDGDATVVAAGVVEHEVAYVHLVGGTA